MTPRHELLAWLRAARGAVRWHVESGERELTVPPGFVNPPLGRAAVPAPPAVTAAPRPSPGETRGRPASPGAAEARGPATTRSAPAPAPPVGLPPEERREALVALTTHIGHCTRCPLSANRTAIVHAVGPVTARLAIVAAAPSLDDETAAEPFRGPAGALLERMLAAMGLGRDDVYLCTVVLCRPPEAREPTQNEVAACAPFLKQRLGLVRPEVIVAFGELPMRALLPQSGSILKARGRWLDWEGIAVMPTWGPTSLLQDPEKKRPAWDDLKKVMTRLGLSGPRAEGGSPGKNP
jgi:uracil-DNA glycosylase family 4